jgi:hypothetical protein
MFQLVMLQLFYIFRLPKQILLLISRTGKFHLAVVLGQILLSIFVIVYEIINIPFISYIQFTNSKIDKECSIRLYIFHVEVIFF